MENGKPDKHLSNFRKNSIGYKTGKLENGESVVFFPGQNASFAVSGEDIEPFDPAATGKPKKGEERDLYICNVCFALKPKDEFDINQKDASGRGTRRPSCQKCRSHLDLKNIPDREKKKWRKKEPRKGALFHCPVCHKHSIVGVNARIVLDHDHHRGKIRGWLCDSCNTGLGRFKNGENLLRNAVDYLETKD